MRLVTPINLLIARDLAGAVHVQSWPPSVEVTHEELLALCEIARQQIAADQEKRTTEATAEPAEKG